MASKISIKSILAKQLYLVVDGALATELEKRGCDLKDPLWSAKILMDDPEAIRQVHLDYFLAGANIAITASYQASERGLAEQRGLLSTKSELLMRQSVELAQRARDEARQILAAHQTDAQPRRNQTSGQALLIAGSVGPYGAYMADGSEYTGAYRLTQQEFKSFHRLRIKALVEAGCDLLACETIPCFPEVQALCNLLAEEFSATEAWISVTLNESGTCMADGTPLDVLAKAIDQSKQIIALGVNCVARDKVTVALTVLKHFASPDLPLVAYPNSGEIYDAENNTWTGTLGDQTTWFEDVYRWRCAGAKLIGGCCRTSPDDIRAIVSALGEQSTSFATSDDILQSLG